MAKKSIVEEALLEARQLEEALKRNSKEILAATMKQDIDEMVKASLYEGDESALEEELENESQVEKPEVESSTMVMDEEEETEMEDSEEETEMEDSEEETEMEDSEEETEMEDSEEEDSFDMTDMGSEDSLDMTDMDSEESDQEDVIDMTSAPDKDLIRVFKNMTDDDEIEVVKTGDEIGLKDKKTGSEYLIKMNESMGYDDEDETMSYDDEDETMSYDEMMKHMEDDKDESMSFDEMMKHMEDSDESSCDECGWSESSDEGETIYEISFEDEGDHSDHSDTEESDESYGASDEGSRRTLHDRRAKQIHPQNYPLDESVKSEYKQVIREYRELKDKYNQTKGALKVFRDKLGEIALFNSNLTHAVKLFMEHATTKIEKVDIMKRFDDEATTLKESKRLYKTITNELKDRKPISEKVEKKINESLTKGSSDTLIESKVYVDPQISKIHELMEKLDNRK